MLSTGYLTWHKFNMKRHPKNKKVSNVWLANKVVSSESRYYLQWISIFNFHQCRTHTVSTWLMLLYHKRIHCTKRVTVYCLHCCHLCLPVFLCGCRYEIGGCWTVRDCMVVYRNTSHVRCQCQRLGTFGVLMDSSHREVSDPSVENHLLYHYDSQL